MSENLHKISGFTLFANSGGFRGGKTPLEKCKPGENRGYFRGFSGGPAKSAGGEIWRILSNLADFWLIFGRISRFFILRKHGRTASGTPPKSPGFPEVHPPGPPGDPPGRKNGPFSGGKTSESTVEGSKFRGGFSGGTRGRISGDFGKFREISTKLPPKSPPIYPLFPDFKPQKARQNSRNVGSNFRGVPGGTTRPDFGEMAPGENTPFSGEKSVKIPY